ncbi:hypothetical protein A3A39_04010 [Candidatus Kaiserbacteria bacterium RIFCSPLOWO2_01_FULL_54_13]|uniref:Uncharacterized protein n=1 Tax=Candidatus Kaiserbacteria bacterium RIFCSPLOWO2_01_FULL_54_13 TaxID=1798512 RepID=A0A1F6F430_9BACT|nr:MAG: hypothetical protein A3A39_04010 [Candidatus Kaiserbacteria bacterium RIFCSPLOWO2_01_FULL_54_13]
MQDAYARALWRVIQEGKLPKEAVAKLRATLERHGRARLLPRVARAFARIAARESSKNAVTLTIAQKKDERMAHKEIKEFLRDMDVSPEDVEVKTDVNLVGGWRLEGREHLIDASFKKYLLDLFERVTTNISAPTLRRGPDPKASGYNRVTT